MPGRFVDHVDMYCHSLRCNEFNRPQSVAVSPASWEQPAEVGHVCCSTCHGDLEDAPRDLDRLFERLTNPLGELETLEQRVLADMYLTSLLHWKEVMRSAATHKRARSYFTADKHYDLA